MCIICLPLTDQFQHAGISVYNNNWSSIYDFTPVPGENNFNLMAEVSPIFCFLPTS